MLLIASHIKELQHQLINVLVGITQNKLILKYQEMKRTAHKPD